MPDNMHHRLGILHRLQVKDLRVTAIIKYIVNIIAPAFRAAPAAPIYL